MPLSRTTTTARPGGCGELQPDGARFGELQGVVGEVAQDAQEEIGVCFDEDIGGASQMRLQTLGMSRGIEFGVVLAQKLVKIEDLVFGNNHAGVEF